MITSVFIDRNYCANKPPVTHTRLWSRKPS